MEELSLDSILTEDQIGNLFGEDIQEANETQEETQDSTPEIDATEASTEELFEQPESVGSEEETKGKKGTSSDRGGSSSDFYSSIAKALVEDGILQDIKDEDLGNIKSAEDFAEAIQSQIRMQLDERQKRVDEALSLGVEPTEVQRYEQYLHALGNITEDSLSSEDEQGENLRKTLIFQDCMNKGFTKERAMKMVDKSFKAGTDIEDAREALNDNKNFYKSQYDSLLKEARQAREEEEKNLREQAEKLKTSILNEEKAFGEITLDKITRQKVYDSISKPVYTDENGDRLTAIQKYEKEHRTEFLKNVGLLFVLTDGFKNIDRLVGDKVKKETRNSLRDLEKTLNGSSGIRGGNLSLMNNSGDIDPESLFKGWKISV